MRLRYAYIIDCHDVVKDADGNITEILCTYDADTHSGSGNSDRKCKGTIHWVSAPHAGDVEVRLYDRLFTVEKPDVISEQGSFLDHLNPDSLQTVRAKVEPSLLEMPVGSRVQFERTGYFCIDPDSQPGRPVFNRTVGLRDSWGKMEAKGKAD